MVEYLDNDEEITGGWANLDWSSPSQESVSLLWVDTPWFDSADNPNNPDPGTCWDWDGIIDCNSLSPSPLPELPIDGGSGPDGYWQTHISRVNELRGELLVEGDNDDFELIFAAPTVGGNVDQREVSVQGRILWRRFWRRRGIWILSSSLLRLIRGIVISVWRGF
ncbi:hypothetical protein [Spirulina sp. 06S082]|uniref:hypothetical protein n=1 Tax=Spirulina sp. 06S082 TaxID=3110248 RepID=UPI002B1FBB81|nr:hypothetical protein [Spirulina sp. 06S082]MEA5469093.1 hypothetical protein [Spirulina sp. 06S082]